MLKVNGCALIFSPIYIDKYDGIDDRTFMYGEEHLLFLRIVRANLKSVFVPDIIIWHEHSAVTNRLEKNRRRKRIKQLRYTIKSLKIILNETELIEKEMNT